MPPVAYSRAGKKRSGVPSAAAASRRGASRCIAENQAASRRSFRGTGFAEDYFRLSGQRLKGPEIITLVEQGDETAELALGRYERRLAKALANVVNILDPDAIVLGGGMSNVDRLYDTVPLLVKQWVFGGECETPILKEAIHGDSSGAAVRHGCGRNRGCALIVFNSLRKSRARNLQKYRARSFSQAPSPA